MRVQESVILVDMPDGVPRVDVEALRNMGHLVRTCRGPRHGEACPILATGGECSLVAEVHGIVFGLDLKRPSHRAILSKYKDAVEPGLPIRVLVESIEPGEYLDLVDGVEIWLHDPTAGELDGFSARVDSFQTGQEPD